MNEIEVVRIDPLELPADIAWQVTGIHQITLKEFYVYIREKDGKMYVNKVVPEKDIEDFIKLATFPGRHVLDPGTEIGDLSDSIYDKYGYATFEELDNYRKHKLDGQDKQEAKEKVQSAVSSIEKMISAGMYNEHLIYEAYKEGRGRKEKTPENICGFDLVYTYCLGYLMGSGALKEKRSPDDSRNVVDYYYGITEMLEHIDIQEMPRIHGYLKELYFPEEAQEGD